MNYLTRDELFDIVKMIDVLNNYKVTEVSFETTVKVWDSNGEVCGTIQNYGEDNDGSTHFFYPGDKEAPAV